MSVGFIAIICGVIILLGFWVLGLFLFGLDFVIPLSVMVGVGFLVMGVLVWINYRYDEDV